MRIGGHLHGKRHEMDMKTISMRQVRQHIHSISQQIHRFGGFGTNTKPTVFGLPFSFTAKACPSVYSSAFVLPISSNQKSKQVLCWDGWGRAVIAIIDFVLRECL